MTLAIGEVLSDRYKIVEKIGVGGMAIVYRADDMKLDRSVTVKVLKEEFTGDKDFKSRFQTEARAAAKLSHPNIVNVYDVAIEESIQYIVMEYVHGDTLKQVIVDNAPFETAVALGIAIQMASALAHAHKNGVVHRDIKPHNILVSVDGTIKITDFGIAHAAVSTATTTTNALGSVYYFSPEQARGGYVDHKSDIYSLGITMFEMLTGKVPYDGDTSVAIALKHLNNPLPSIKEVNPNVSSVVENIIKKATQKKKDDRYATTELLLADLKRALTEENAKEKAKVFDDSIIPAVNPITIDIPAAVTNAKKEQSLNIEIAKEVQEIKEPKEIKEPIKDTVQPEIKVEVPRKKKEYDIPESAVGFDKYNKKLKISKDDDYEEDYMPSKQQHKNNNNNNNKTAPQKRKKRYEEMDDSQYRETEKKVTIAAVITSIVIIAIITVFGARFFTGSFLGGNSSVAKASEMPSIIGMTMEDANRAVADIELTINVTGEEYNDEFSEGRIISQAIDVGESVSRGDEIGVVLSRGIARFTMPNLAYENVEDAIATVKSLGGKEPVVEYVFDNTVPATVVVTQSPAAQTEITSSTVINLKVSKGPETPTVTVPKFVGMKVSDAQAKMLELGLVLGTVREDNTASGEKDTIISQSLVAGDVVDRDTRINFVVVGETVTSAPETTPETTPDTKPDTTTPETEKEEETTTPLPTAPATTGSKSFSISAPANYENEDSISVKMLRISNGSTVDVIYNQTKSIGEFPFGVTVSGSGDAEIQLYIDNVYQWSENVTFTEGGN